MDPTVCISRLPGIGPVKKQQFNDLGIVTIEDLARCKDESVKHIKQYAMLKLRAEEIVQESKPASEVVCTRHCIQSHNWWEQQIILPNESDHKEFRFAVIYELSLETFNRVSFICAWVTEDSNETSLCTMSFSPQYIFYYNPTLPLLEVQMTQENLDRLPNKFVLLNTLSELQAMHSCPRI